MSCRSFINGKVFEYDQENQWADDFSKRIRTHEPQTNTKLMELMKDAPTNSYIIDAGAHVGDTGLLMASELTKYGKKTKVIEIDPDATKLDFIQKTATIQFSGQPGQRWLGLFWVVHQKHWNSWFSVFWRLVLH